MASLYKPNRPTGSYDPWNDFFNLENFFPQETRKQGNQQFPAVNISEDEKSFCVDVVAPGFKKEDFKVNVEEDMLTISAESKTENREGGSGKQYTRREYNYNSFTRAFRLPDNVKDDAIQASYKEGILSLDIPKTTQQLKVTKEISVS
jgi:HSP20 family protein